jgi:Transglutaminase-like superfamily
MKTSPKLNQTVSNPQSLRELADQIRVNILKDVEDARLRELGAQIIEKYNVPQRSPKQLARAFQLFGQEIKFFREFPEVNAAPWITAKWKIGDCDDKARLIAALLKSFRIPVRLTYMTFEIVKSDGTKEYKSHVWPEVNLDDTWVSLESVRPWPMGKSALDAIKAKNLKHSVFSVEI